MMNVYIVEFIELMKERNAVRLEAEKAMKMHDQAVFSGDVEMMVVSESHLDSAMDKLGEIDEMLELVVREAGFTLGQVEELERECLA